MARPLSKTQTAEVPIPGHTDHEQQGWGGRFLVSGWEEVWLRGTAYGLWKLKLGPMSRGAMLGVMALTGLGLGPQEAWRGSLGFWQKNAVLWVEVRPGG